MGQETSTAPAAQAANHAAPHIYITPGGEEGFRMYAREIATYLRELPRLLDEGYAGKYALVKGDEILSIWDTDNDAIQAGRDRFGLDPIFVMTIDPRHQQRFAWLKAQMGASCPF
jgi:hypothetical protein